MHKRAFLFVLIALTMLAGQASQAHADVVIKVRALNPLDTTETAVINYPLPREISQDNIRKKKITYSMDHSEDEEPPASSFQISVDESTGGLFIDDEVVLYPKEVVTLEVHVQDVWVIDPSRIRELQDEVEGLLTEWESEAGEPESGAEDEAAAKEQETKSFAVQMKGDILDALKEVLLKQEENSIIQAGVERHIEVYNENIEQLRQIQQDIVLLANLIQLEGSPPAEEPVDEAVMEDESAQDMPLVNPDETTPAEESGTE